MNMKMKALAAVVALAAAGSANATIFDSSSGNGSLYFSIRDNVNLTSYVLDMGVRMDSWLVDGTANNHLANQTWAADSLMASFLTTGSGNYSWAVMAADSTGGASVGGVRFMTTAATGNTTLANETNVGLFQWNALDGQLIVGSNAAITAAGNGLSGTRVNGDDGYFASTMDNWAGNSPANAATAGLGGSQSFYLLTNTGSITGLTTKAKPVLLTEQAGKFTLAANGDLNYVATPVPAAVWLLGSALVGLVGVSRRREEQV